MPTFQYIVRLGLCPNQFMRWVHQCMVDFLKGTATGTQVYRFLKNIPFCVIYSFMHAQHSVKCQFFCSKNCIVCFNDVSGQCKSQLFMVLTIKAALMVSIFMP